MHFNGPPGGRSPYERDAINETHRMKRQDAANARFAKEASGKENNRLHKLMQSGTPWGKVVKFFYRLIWDVSYR